LLSISLLLAVAAAEGVMVVTLEVEVVGLVGTDHLLQLNPQAVVVQLNQNCKLSALPHRPSLSVVVVQVQDQQVRQVQ
jgi:hypothetical protein